MGGAGGYSCSAEAPKECVQFLDYLVTKNVQVEQYKAFNSLPITKEAQSAVTEDYLKAVLDATTRRPTSPSGSTPSTARTWATR